MFEKEKRKGVPARSLWYLIAGVAIGIVSMLAIFVIISRPHCMIECGEMRPTATAVPPYPTPTFIPTSTPMPSLTPTSIPTSTPLPSDYDPYELRAFVVNKAQSLIALSYWSGEQGVLETRPWLDQHIGEIPVTHVVNSPLPYERIGFHPNQSILMAWQMQDSNGEVILFDLEKDAIMPIADSVYSPDGRWYAHAASGQIIFYESQKPVAQLTLEGIYDSMAFSPLGDMVSVVSRDGNDGYYLEVFSLTENTPRILRRAFAGNLTSPVVYHPDGKAVAVADDLKILLISLVEEPDFTVSTYNTPIRFIAFDLTRGVLAAGGGNPDNGEAAMVYLFFLDKTIVHPESTRVQGIVIEDEVIGLQAINGLFVGTRHSIASIRSFADDQGIFGWTLEPILTTSKDGITLVDQ